jgi:hypothetical protein
VVVLAALLVVVAAPAPARADGSNDVRVTRSCTAGSTVRLRVRERDGDLLRVDVDLQGARSGTAWIATIVHERRVALRATRRSGAGSRSLSVRVAIPDWPGPDTVTVRALGQRGEICRATATLPEADVKRDDG